MDNRTLKKFLRLTRDKKALDVKLEKVKQDLKESEKVLRAQFEKAGLDSTKVDGTTIYLHRQVWARAKDGDRGAVLVALRETEMDEYITENFNTNSLSAYVRECEKEGQEIPEKLKACLEITEVFSLRTRSS